MSQRSEDPSIDILDLELFSKRFLNSDDLEDVDLGMGEFTKAVKRSASGGSYPRTMSWLSLGMSNKPSTPPRG
jgi:hypothetical protein